jgi:hypothetical protein
MLTKQDITHLVDTLTLRMEGFEEGDDNGPEDVMVSIGYVSLFTDGTVVQYGRVIYTLVEGMDEGSNISDDVEGSEDAEE